MERSGLRRLLALGIAVGCLLTATSPASSAVIDLGYLSGDRTSWATAISDNGNYIAGISQGSDYSGHAFLYSNGGMTDLGFNANWINVVDNTGQIWGTTSAGEVFRYSNGVMTDLGTFGVSGFGGLRHINNSGQIAYTSDVSGNSHAFLYSAGVRTDLGTSGGSSSVARNINNSGQVVGYSSAADGQHVFLYSAGVMTDLGLGSDALINNNGQVFFRRCISDIGHAFLYSGGSLTDLGIFRNPGELIGFTLIAIAPKISYN
jgi:probable HAF family extracellular repeat protein